MKVCTEVNLPDDQGAMIVAVTHRVHLSENRSLAEEERLPGVYEYQVKVGLPGSVGGASLWAGRRNTSD